ncbi:MAG: hypothetical protein ACYS6Z_09105 [Planctomycetota bacterium]
MMAIPRRHNRTVAAILASLGFLILVIGVTYFAILVLATRYSEAPEERFAAGHELGQFLGTRDPEWAWYKDARVYGGASLLFALTSILFGVHKLARITIVVSGLAYALLHIWGDAIREALNRWALGG